MRHEARGDVIKVWLYAAASVMLGAWVSPFLYNAGKALAEVSTLKSTNGFLEWLAELCRRADFPAFYVAGVFLAAMVLFLPWMEWIHAKRGEVSGLGPWKFRLPGGARTTSIGQALRKNLEGPWHTCAGFMLVAGLLLSMGVALVPAGFFRMSHPGDGMLPLAGRILFAAFAAALVIELFFRGVAMGIFLRGMRPALALGMSAAFFALVISALPLDGVVVADPEAPGTGFHILRTLAARFADWRFVIGEFAPLLALGAVLAYARWRTASLWLPVGLHTGWRFAKGLLESLSTSTAAQANADPALNGNLLQQGLVPLIAIVAAGVLAHHLTAEPDDERSVRF